MVKVAQEKIEQTSVSSGSKPSVSSSSLKISKSKTKDSKAHAYHQSRAHRKMRVLHVAGSSLSKYYESVSLIYGLPSFVHGPRDEFEHIFAKVSLNQQTGKTVWQFDDSVPKDKEHAK